MLAGAGLFFLWEVYAAVRWVHQAGGLGAAPGHFWDAIRADGTPTLLAYLAWRLLAHRPE